MIKEIFQKEDSWWHYDETWSNEHGPFSSYEEAQKEFEYYCAWLNREREIFVFGSNELGVHGAGAAKFAMKNHGAVYGQGVGIQGNSYGIPTKGLMITTLPLDRIKFYIDQFIEYAKIHKELYFNITHIGCGLAGYNWEKDILPLFPNPLPNNCRFITE